MLHNKEKPNRVTHAFAYPKFSSSSSTQWTTHFYIELCR